MQGWSGIACVLGVSFALISCTNPRSTIRKKAPTKPPKARTIKVDPTDKSPFSHAILVNGGQRPSLNFYSHLVHLRGIRKVLKQREMRESRITIFASDGDSSQPDLAVVDALPSDIRWLFRFRPERAFFEPAPRYINTVIKGKRIYPSTKAQLGDFFGRLGRRLPRLGGKAKKYGADGRPVLLFVTDHGERNRAWKGPRNQIISMWRETMTVENLYRMLRPLRHRRVVYLMSQCFSGSFAWSVFPRPGMLEAPSGKRCGFFSTLATRYAYGCYPETQKEQAVGHAHRFIQALAYSRTMVQAHRRVLLTDETPDVPLRSSDVYLKAILAREARRSRIKLAALVEQMFKRHGSKGASILYEEQKLLDALAHRFDLARPRSLKEIYKRIEYRRKRMKFRKGIERMWKEAYAALRTFELREFYLKHQGLEGRLKQKWHRLLRSRKLRKSYQKDPDVQLLRQGFLAHLKKSPKIARRIKELEGHLLLSRKLHFWNEVQEAVLQRMAFLYYRMAGKLLLKYEGRPMLRVYAQGLRRLVACESTAVGKTSLQPPSLAPIKKDHNASIPSILGISYRPVRKSKDPRVARGAVQVRFVGMDSPAEAAGLKSGDIINGLDQLRFRASYQLRENVMLAKPDSQLTLRVIRGKKSLRLPVKLQRMKTANFVKLRPILGQSLSEQEFSPLTPLQGQQPVPKLKSSTLLLFFWATWCGPCKRALPTLRRWHRDYASKGLKILAVSKEKAKTLNAWYGKNPRAMPFSRMRDKDGKLSFRLRIFVAPTLILMRNGKIVLIHKGAAQLQVVQKAISKALAP